MGASKANALATFRRKGRDLLRARVLQRDVVSFYLAIVLLCANSAIGLALDHSGLITSDETWYAADNPHNIVSTVTVLSDVTLTLEEGVEVLSGQSLNLTAQGSLVIEDGVNVLLGYQSRIYIQGTLTAVGSPGTGILFSKSGTLGWDGVQFAGAGSGVFDHCTIEEIGSPSSIAGIVANSSGTVSLSNTTIRASTYGISVSDGVVALTNVLLVENNHGIKASGGTVQLTNVSLADNSTGFSGDGVLPSFLDENTSDGSLGGGSMISLILC